MLIECIAKVSGTVETAISNDVYVFRPDAQGRLVCDVDREEHQAAFLSLTGVYRAAEAVSAPAPEAAAVEPEAPTAPEEPGPPAEAPADTLAGKTWDELAVLYEAKFDRKPHSKASVATLIERLTA
jgi:hypothetical protein